MFPYSLHSYFSELLFQISSCHFKLRISTGSFPSQLLFLGENRSHKPWTHWYKPIQFPECLPFQEILFYFTLCFSHTFNIFLYVNLLLKWAQFCANSSLLKQLLSFSLSPSHQSFLLVVQPLRPVWLFATPWTVTCQASLSFTVSWSLLKFMSIEFFFLTSSFY